MVPRKPRDVRVHPPDGASPQPAPPVAAVGYIRVSTMREEKISPELQRTAIKAKARRDGYKVTEWIEELDVSGRGFARKGVQRAIEMVEAGQAAVIYVWKFSRFGRNAALTGSHVAQVEEAGGRVVSATEDVDARTAIGKFMRRTVWNMDELYSDMVGDSWRETHAKRLRDGLPHSGHPRFGFTYHHTSSANYLCPQGCKPGECVTGYVIDPETAGAVEWMYASYNAGMSVLKIAVELNSRGLRQPTRPRNGQPAASDGRWDQRGVRRFMDSGFAAGFLRVHDPACSCGKPQACKRKVLVPGVHEAIIGEQVWESYLRQRKARSYLPPRVETPVYPLAGLVRCGVCKGPLNAGQKQGSMYMCASYKRSRGCPGVWIARRKVEEVVFTRFVPEISEDVSGAARAERGRLKARKTSAGARRRLAAEAARHDKALTALTVRLAEGLVPEDVYKAARDELVAKRDAAQAALERLATDEDRLSTPPVQVAAGLGRDWPTLPPAALRSILGHLVDRIEVHKDDGRSQVRVVSAWGEVYTYEAC